MHSTAQKHPFDWFLNEHRWKIFDELPSSWEQPGEKFAINKRSTPMRCLYWTLGLSDVAWCMFPRRWSSVYLPVHTPLFPQL